MAICDGCDQEMKTADSCISDGTEVETYGDQRCHDCNVAPGGTHHWGCDTERCTVCKGQLLVCACEDHEPDKARWLGVWPGTIECKARGWYSRLVRCDNREHISRQELIDNRPPCGVDRVPCGADDEGASPDVGRWLDAGCPSP